MTTLGLFFVKNYRRNIMNRNEELAESLKKHEHEHRNLASILLNERNLHGFIKATVALLLLSFESYIDSEEKPFPEWEFVNFEEVVGKDRKEKEMEAFLKANPLPGSKKEREKKKAVKKPGRKIILFPLNN